MSKIALGNVTIDRDRYEVWVEGRLIRLTFVEFELLWEMARHAPSVISRRHLMRTVWHEPSFEQSRKINIQICRLRTKMKGADWIIETHAKRGYALADANSVRNRVPTPLAGIFLFFGRLPGHVDHKITSMAPHGLLFHRPSTAIVAAFLLLTTMLFLALGSVCPTVWSRITICMSAVAALAIASSGTARRAAARGVNVPSHH